MIQPMRQIWISKAWPTRDSCRQSRLRVLAQARAAQSLPWDARRTLYWRTVFPQMTNWLPDAEAAQLRFEFETEIRRLEAA